MKQFRFNPEKLRKAREQAGFSRKDLEKLTGVDLTTIQAWEKGYRSPSLRNFVRIAKVLGLPVEYFFDEICDESLIAHG